ncbi:MAG: RNA polymerase-associated protein RapA [Gammaproteobacteria bacterium]|nr:RNA polymerase-associated protein RapA [Gammaproteobacteria bacterium]
MNVVIGQRWVSHTESNLGLGIITEVTGRIVTVSFPAIAETRNYARENAPLSRIRYAVSDTISNMDEEDFIIIEVLEEKGLIGYLCHNNEQEEFLLPELDLNCFVQLSTPRQRLLSGQFGGNSEFRLRLETLKHLNRLEQSSVSGLQGARAELLPHQIYIANEVAKRHAPRVLLADEVGLGKTIEAGLILHQQIHTGQAQRILILVPDSLLHQWLVEMLRRFNLPFSLFNKERLEALMVATSDEQEVEDINPFDTEQQILCNLSLMVSNPLIQQQVLSSHWDLVIIDEAHHLHWSEDSSSPEYDFVEQLAERCDGLLLLTATPEQVGVDSHFARLRLLDADRFYDLQKFKAEEQGFQKLNTAVDGIQRIIEDNTLSSNKIMVNDIRAHLPENLHTDFLNNMNNPEQLQQLIRRLLDQHGTGRVLFRNTRSAVKGFPERVLHQYPLPCPDIYSDLLSDNINDLLHPESLLTEDEWIIDDPRVEWLQQFLKSLKNKKALVICHHAQTAKTLDKYLNLRAGIRCTSFYPGLSIIERDRAAAYFAEPDAGAQVLICSEIGSEGRNFQFAHHLVLFDLPLNPDLIEQRIGRLDRIGQEQAIQIHVPYLQQTAQEVIFSWYHHGLNLFQKSCSAGFAIFEKFESLLIEQLIQADDNLESLITETTDYTQKLLKQMQEGRDRLLELNSCDPEIAKGLIENIKQEEQNGELTDYMERVFDEFGVDHDYHSEHALVIKPTDHMLSDHFPGLNDEGNTITFDRNKALSREDMEYLSWEHPMVVDIMDAISSSDIGNASVATISIKGLKPGTLLLESCFTVEKMAPRDLQLHRYLPVQPIRMVFNTEGKDLSKVVSHENLNKMTTKLKMRVARPVVEQVRDQIEIMIDHSQVASELLLPAIIEQAKLAMQQSLGEELERLKSLQAINPNIRDGEIEFLQHQIDESCHYIDNAKLQMQAIRLIINS